MDDFNLDHSVLVVRRARPTPAAVRPAGPACVLRGMAAAEQQFGDAIAGLINASQQQGQQPEAGPPTVPMVQMCDGTPTRVVWVTPRTPCPPGGCPPPVTPQATAMALLQKIPMPTASIAMFPSQTYGRICGIVGSFWATGYDGKPIRWSGPTAGGGVVDALATPQGFDWDFGDGARVESSGTALCGRSWLAP